MTQTWIQHLVTIESAPPLRLWTGQGGLRLDGKLYRGGGAALKVGAAETAAGDPDRRLTLTLSGIPKDLRSKFLQDAGPQKTTVEWVYSQDSGKSWRRIEDLSFRGRLSTPSLVEGALQVEIETLRGDVDRGRPLRWSHEDQQRRFPGDKGLEYMRALAQQGQEASWPP